MVSGTGGIGNGYLVITFDFNSGEKEEKIPITVEVDSGNIVQNCNSDPGGIVSNLKDELCTDLGGALNNLTDTCEGVSPQIKDTDGPTDCDGPEDDNKLRIQPGSTFFQICRSGSWISTLCSSLGGTYSNGSCSGATTIPPQNQRCRSGGRYYNHGQTWTRVNCTCIGTCLNQDGRIQNTCINGTTVPGICTGCSSAGCGS